MFIDGELPEPFKSELEKHASDCLDCTKTIQTFKTIQDELRNDAKDISFSKKELDDSFCRLQTKLRFADVTKVVENPNPFKRSFIYRLVPAIAAALIIAVVLPLRLFTIPSVATPTDIPLLSSQNNALQASFVQEKGIIRDDSLKHYTVDVSSIQLTSMDLFRPELSDNGVMKISITLTGVANLPISKIDRVGDFVDSLDMMGLIPVDYKSDKNN
jgi:hypothetical protein